MTLPMDKAINWLSRSDLWTAESNLAMARSIVARLQAADALVTTNGWSFERKAETYRRARDPHLPTAEEVRGSPRPGKEPT